MSRSWPPQFNSPPHPDPRESQFVLLGVILGEAAHKPTQFIEVSIHTGKENEMEVDFVIFNLWRRMHRMINKEEYFSDTLLPDSALFGSHK